MDCKERCCNSADIARWNRVVARPLPSFAEIARALCGSLLGHEPPYQHEFNFSITNGMLTPPDT